VFAFLRVIFTECVQVTHKCEVFVCPSVRVPHVSSPKKKLTEILLNLAFGGLLYNLSGELILSYFGPV
jgi:hypothetical protein